MLLHLPIVILAALPVTRVADDVPKFDIAAECRSEGDSGGAVALYRGRDRCPPAASGAMGPIQGSREGQLHPGNRHGWDRQLCRTSDLPGDGERRQTPLGSGNGAAANPPAAGPECLLVRGQGSGRDDGVFCFHRSSGQCPARFRNNSIRRSRFLICCIDHIDFPTLPRTVVAHPGGGRCRLRGRSITFGQRQIDQAARTFAAGHAYCPEA